MIKKFVIAIIGLSVVIGGIVFVKMKQFAPPPPFAFPPEAVTSAIAVGQSWEQIVTATGTVKAFQGLKITSELSGKVSRIVMESGQTVKAGDLLIELDVSNEQAQLKTGSAAEKLASLNLERAKQLHGRTTISEAELDTASAQAEEAIGRVNDLRATIAKKQIRAPFAGRLGIRQVELGQYLSPGTTISSLQNLDTVYVDFTIPQKQMSSVGVGYSVRALCDTFSGKPFSGKVSAIEPDVDASTRTLTVRATVPNVEGKLLPGMFVAVDLVQPQPLAVIAIPSTSIYYQSFGNVIFVIKDKPTVAGQSSPADGKGVKIVEERLVRLGQKRGDFVQVLEGLKEGEEVVSAGVFKLSNGRAVVVNNKNPLPYSITPKPQDS